MSGGGRQSRRQSTLSHFPLRQAALAAALIILVLLANLLHIGDVLSIAGVKARLGDLQTVYAQHPLLAVAAFVAIQALALAMCLPGAVLALALAGGAIFGPLWGVPIVLAAITAGDSLGFLLARYLLRDFLAARFRRRLAEIPAGEGAAYLLGMRLMAVVPYFFVNITMALTDMRLRIFAPVSFAGLIPSTIIYVGAGSMLAKIERASDVWTPPLLATFVILGLLPLAGGFAHRRLREKRS